MAKTKTKKKPFVSRKDGAKARQKHRTAATDSKAVAVVNKPTQGSVPAKATTLDLAKPEQVMEFGVELKKHIVKYGLSTNIQGREYAHVDAWKYAGRCFGLTGIPNAPKAIHRDGQYICIIYISQEIIPKDKKKKPFKKEVPVFIGFLEHESVIESVRERYKDKISRELVKPYYEYECECKIVNIITGQEVNFGVGICSNIETTKAGFEKYAVNSMSQTRSIGKGFRNLLGDIMNAAGYESTPAEEMDQVQQYEMDTYADFPPDPVKDKSKQTLTEKGFAKLRARAEKGEKVLEEAMKHLALSQEQIDAIKIIESNIQLSKNG